MDRYRYAHPKHTKARLEELQLHKMLKDETIAQTQVQFGPLYPAGSTFDVVTSVCACEEFAEHGRHGVGAFLIVYPEPHNFAKWTCLGDCECGYETVAKALEALLAKLQGHEGDREYYMSLCMTERSKKDKEW